MWHVWQWRRFLGENLHWIRCGRRSEQWQQCRDNSCGEEEASSAFDSSSSILDFEDQSQRSERFGWTGAACNGWE